MSSSITADPSGKSVRESDASKEAPIVESSSKCDTSSQTQASTKESIRTVGQTGSFADNTARGRGGHLERGRGRGWRGGRGRGGTERNHTRRDDTSTQTNAPEGSTAGGSSMSGTMMTGSTQLNSTGPSSIGQNRLKSGWPLKNASDMKDQIWSTITSLIELYLGQMKKLGTDQYKERLSTTFGLGQVVVLVAQGKHRVGLEPRDVNEEERRPREFQDVTHEDYETHISAIFRKDQDFRKGLTKKTLYHAAGELTIDFVGGHVVLREATVAYVQSGALSNCWQAEMIVQELVWNDKSTDKAEDPAPTVE